MRTAIMTGAFLLLALSSSGSSPSELPPLETVPHVDLRRYAGRWYEVASFPQRFQKGCVDSRADYRLLDDGDIEVVNSCLKEGTLDIARGKAWVADGKTQAKLKVSFFWPFRGDYWIIELGKDYEYAVVSAPSRKYLWILAREPRMDADLYAAVLGRLKERGFDVQRLGRTYRGVRTDP